MDGLFHLTNGLYHTGFTPLWDCLLSSHDSIHKCADVVLELVHDMLHELLYMYMAVHEVQWFYHLAIYMDNPR